MICLANCRRYYDVRHASRRHSFMSLPVVGLLAGVFGLSFGGFRSLQRGFEADIENRLNGPHKTITVRTKLDLGALNYDIQSVRIAGKHFSTDELPFFTEPDRPKDGRVRTLRISLSDFTIAGLHAEALDATIPDCRFDLDMAVRHRKIRLSASGIGLGSVTVSEEDLRQFLLKKYPQIHELTVSLSHGRAVVRGRGQLMMFETSFFIDARLIVVDGVRLMIDDPRITLGGTQTEDHTAQAIVNIFNPVLDLDKDLKMHGAMHIETLTVDGGTMVARGAAIIPERSKVTDTEPAIAPARPYRQP